MTPPNVRRSKRSILPNTFLMYRRQIIRENFFKSAKKKPNGKIISAMKSKITPKVQKKSKKKANPPVLLNGSHDDGDDKLATHKTEIEDDTIEPANLSFVVTKDSGIASPIHGGIHPTYYPSEEENSGVIVFKKNSPRLKLNISFAKCFVILNGKFCIDLAGSDNGEFQNGDFIKAPAGSTLGIKYMGDDDGHGKIIFFKSIS